MIPLNSDEITALRCGKRIAAIKMYRERAMCGLVYAREAVDAYESENGRTVLSPAISRFRGYKRAREQALFYAYVCLDGMFHRFQDPKTDVALELAAVSRTVIQLSRCEEELAKWAVQTAYADLRKALED